jgi:hypothetical protein
MLISSYYENISYATGDISPYGRTPDPSSATLDNVTLTDVSYRLGLQTDK